MRRMLDGIYGAALLVAAFCLVMIAVLVFLQVAGRIIDRVMIILGFDALGLAVPSIAEIGGFLFVASSCLAFAATLRSGTHVRVSLLSNALGPRMARILDIAMLAGAVWLACFAAWHSGIQVIDSWSHGSVSYGVIPVPLWLPQMAMSAGFAILAIAVADELVSSIGGAGPAFREAESVRGFASGAE